MCMANGSGLKKLLGKVYMNSPAQKLKDEIAKNDPLSKALGYEAGLADPLGDEMARWSGGRSRSNQRALRIGDRQNEAMRDANYKELVYNSRPGHVRSISQRDSRRG